MKIACISFTEDGKRIGNKLVKYRDNPEFSHTYVIHHYENSKIAGGIKGVLKNVFEEYEGIIFISATGIAVRMITPYIKNKTTDPAVIVIDDLGRYSISLLSGHIGGANELTEWSASILGTIPIITTASDGRGIEAIDIFAKCNGYEIEDIKPIKNIMTMMINGKKIGFYTEKRKIINYKNIVLLKDLKNLKNISGIIVVTSIEDLNIKVPHVILRPKNINIGIGCRKGMGGDRIIEAIKEELTINNLSEKSIKALGTIEIKQNEKGIIEAANYFNCPLNIFTPEEISKVENRFEKSQFVKSSVGVYSVSEPCAFLLGGDMKVYKRNYNGITLSIAVEVDDG